MLRVHFPFHQLISLITTVCALWFCFYHFYNSSLHIVPCILCVHSNGTIMISHTATTYSSTIRIHISFLFTWSIKKRFLLQLETIFIIETHKYWNSFLVLPYKWAKRISTCSYIYKINEQSFLQWYIFFDYLAWKVKEYNTLWWLHNQNSLTMICIFNLCKCNFTNTNAWK